MALRQRGSGSTVYDFKTAPFNMKQPSGLLLSCASQLNYESFKVNRFCVVMLFFY